MNPKQAKIMLERIEREHPELIGATCNTIVKETITWAQQSIARDIQIVNDLAETKRVVVELLTAMRGEGPMPDVGAPDTGAPDADAAPNPHSHPAPHGNGAPEDHSVPRVNLDGTSMSQEDIEREAMMDAAISGLPPTPAPAPTPINVGVGDEGEAQATEAPSVPRAAPGRPQTRVSRGNKTSPNAS